MKRIRKSDVYTPLKAGYFFAGLRIGPIAACSCAIEVLSTKSLPGNFIFLGN
jgi:hypothetical protein